MKISGIIKLHPQGTNSTFFTNCCKVAITDDQPNCPMCNTKVIGWDAEPGHKRHQVRWNHAYIKPIT